MSFPSYERCRASNVEWIGDVPHHWAPSQGRRVFGQTRNPASDGDEPLSATQKYGVIPQSLFMRLEDQKVVLALSGTEEFKHVDVDDFVFSLRSFQSGIERLIYAGCVSPAYTVLKARNAGDARYWAFLLKIDPYIAALQSVTREDSNLQPDRYERAAAGRSRKDDVRGYLPGSGAGGARGSSA